jgi:2-C-methyl-D-erythritol 4-phosphate cytidylyltransferase
MVALIDDMVDEFVEGDHEVLAMGLPATEAVKWVESDFIKGDIDRSRLVTVKCPEVMRRDLLDAALDDAGDAMWINPTELVVSAGGSLRIYDPTARRPVA